MYSTWTALVGGAAGFVYCLGMCGPLALHLSHGAGRRAVLGRQLLWHAGKLATYVFLGAIAGFAGGWISSATLPWVQNILAYAAGGFMIVMGLALLGMLPKRPGAAGPATGRAESAAQTPAPLLASLFRQFFVTPSAPAALVLGVAAGFLPCPLVMAFLASAVAGGSVPAGMAVMAAMGVGTTWSLLVLGLTGQALAQRWRRWARPAGAVIVIVLGIVTVLRGTDVFHRFLGCPQHSAACCASRPATESQSTPVLCPQCATHPATGPGS